MKQRLVLCLALVLLSLQGFATGQEKKFVCVHATKTKGPIYEFCDTMPEFPGGQQAMFKFIAEHLQWPTIAREWTGNWRVVIKFIVEADGTLSCPQFVYRTDTEFENEALKVWRQFPRFKPAIKGGRPVRCWFVVPIRFKGL